jgi:hypothetical protein
MRKHREGEGEPTATAFAMHQVLLHRLPLTLTLSPEGGEGMIINSRSSP